MPPLQWIELGGQRFVVIGEREYDRLRSIADAESNEDVMPALPLPDENGRYAAAEYALASLARDIIRDRKKAGLSRAELARIAGISAATLARVESGKSKSSLRTIEKIDDALKKVLASATSNEVG